MQKSLRLPLVFWLFRIFINIVALLLISVTLNVVQVLFVIIFIFVLFRDLSIVDLSG